jgi:hypothetical protein
MGRINSEQSRNGHRIYLIFEPAGRIWGKTPLIFPGVYSGGWQ